MIDTQTIKRLIQELVTELGINDSVTQVVDLGGATWQIHMLSADGRPRALYCIEISEGIDDTEESIKAEMCRQLQERLTTAL